MWAEKITSTGISEKQLVKNTIIKKSPKSLRIDRKLISQRLICIVVTSLVYFSLPFGENGVALGQSNSFKPVNSNISAYDTT